MPDHDNTTSGMYDSFLISDSGKIYAKAIEQIEKKIIEKALERTFGNQLKAAKILGINRNTLRTKIAKLGIRPGQWKI